jgi:hypothetical protein
VLPVCREHALGDLMLLLMHLFLPIHQRLFSPMTIEQPEDQILPRGTRQLILQFFEGFF